MPDMLAIPTLGVNPYVGIPHTQCWPSPYSGGMKPRTPVAQRLHDLREALDLEQVDVADRIGVARSTVANYEIGKVMPPPKRLTALAALYNVTIDEILTGAAPLAVPEAAQIVEDPDELALLREHLHAVATPLADVDQAVA